MTDLNLELLTDEDLVDVCRARSPRDDRPFRELFRRYQNVVWRICYGVVRNSQDAEDLTQEVFVSIYRNLKHFEGRSSLKTWIYRIAINTSRNELRRRARRPQLAGKSIEDMSDFLEGEGTVELYWLSQIRNANLREAIQQLSSKQFEVIRLRDFEQRSYEEIAKLLGISLSATKMRIQRARLMLQQKYSSIELAETEL